MRSIRFKNRRNSSARWRAVMSAITLPGGHVQGGVEVGGAVAHVVVGAPLGVPGISGSTGAVRSSAWIWDFSSTHSTTAASGGLRYSPTMSRTLSMNCGSGDSLKSRPVRLEPERPPDPADRGLVHAGRRGHRPGRPVRRFAGVSSKVLTITRSTSSSPILRGWPGRGSSMQTVDTAAREPFPPLADRRRVAAQPRGDLRVRSHPRRRPTRSGNATPTPGTLSATAAHRSRVSRSSSSDHNPGSVGSSLHLHRRRSRRNSHPPRQVPAN